MKKSKKKQVETAKKSKKVTNKLLCDIPALIDKRLVNGQVYFNIHLTIGDMSFEVEPKWLNLKQRTRLKHVIYECFDYGSVKPVQNFCED